MINRVLFAHRTNRIFPDDNIIANRYITWKNLLDKFDKRFEDDEDGLSMDEALDLYEDTDVGNSDQQQNVEEAVESANDSDSDKENEQSSNFTALKEQLAIDLRQRTAEWKNNGMEKIFNSNFSLSVDHVQKWLHDSQPGTSKQMTQERETRFTEYDGNTQMNVTHKENVSILNETQKQELAMENNSSCVYTDNSRRRVIVHQIEKTTISSYMIEPHGFNVADVVCKLNLNSFVQSIPNITPFKIPSLRPTPSVEARTDKVMQLSKLGNGKGVNTSALANSSLASLVKSALTLVPKSRVVDDMKQRNGKHNKQQRVQFKPTRKYKPQGIVIYRPKQLDRSKPPGQQQKICINTNDLDLSGIKSSVRRKKFDNFSRLTDPHATLVYYESDDETILVNDSDDLDCSDDPILNFKPELCILAFSNDDGQKS
uniref:Uncharacterized protein n=1 Tax=Anopheles christyi TaxID=43041 RepID=A0A182KE38_9DIPT